MPGSLQRLTGAGQDATGTTWNKGNANKEEKAGTRLSTARKKSYLWRYIELN